MIVANFYETYNFLNKEVKKEIDSSVLFENYTKIIKIMSPIVPHFAAECLEELKSKEKELSWPSVEKKYLEKNDVNIVVQINGKKRSLINTEKDLEENEVVLIVKNDLTIKKYLDEKKIKKAIYIKNKLINLII